MKRLLELHWEILAPKSVLNSVFDALLEKRRKDFKLHYHHNRKRYFGNHMQSTLGGGLQYLSLKSIFSTPNEQRKRSNPNGSLLLNFQLNFSKRTSTDVLLILLIFDFRFDNRHIYRKSVYWFFPYRNIYIYIYIYIYVYIYIYICMYVCMYVYIYIYIYK